MALQFDHIFTGKRSWAREIQGNTTVHNLPFRVTEVGELGITGLGLLAADGLNDLSSLFA
jgi:hypothetical protein